MNKKGRKNTSLLFWIFLIIGVFLLVFPHVVRYYHHFKNEKSFHEFMISNDALSDEEVNEMMDRVKQCNAKIMKDSSSFMDPFDSNQENVKKMKDCLGINSNEMFAVLEIPKLDLVAPIYLDATDVALDKGIGLVEGSSLPIGGEGTHTVLAGHRGLWTQEMLMYVDRVGVGEYFYIHTMSETLSYKVYDQSIIYPDETEILEIQPGKDLATLITCHPLGANTQRLLIHGERTVR